MRVDQDSKVASNVISIFAPKAKMAEEKSETEPLKEVSQEAHDFAEELRRNEAVAERMRKERQKANRSVLRSYRLKT
jgi:hypothetical protein